MYDEKDLAEEGLRKGKRKWIVVSVSEGTPLRPTYGCSCPHRSRPSSRCPRRISSWPGRSLRSHTETSWHHTPSLQER